MKNKKIAWEKWNDDIIEDEARELIMDQFEEEDEDEVLEAFAFLEKIPKLVSTPTGIYQLHDKMSVLNQFDCWLGYTNFDITKKVKSTLERAEGVELLDIMSRYRFFIGVGKLFNFSEVRRDIESILCDNSISDETLEAVEVLKANLSVDKYWTILISNTGEIKYASTNDENDEKYLKKALDLEQIKERSGGSLLKSLDEL